MEAQAVRQCGRYPADSVLHVVIGRHSRQPRNQDGGRQGKEVPDPCNGIMEQAREQLTREPRPLPRLKLGDVGSIFDLDADAIAFEGYDPWPAIKAKVAV